jgi:hypothetical protein
VIGRNHFPRLINRDFTMIGEGGRMAAQEVPTLSRPSRVGVSAVLLCLVAATLYDAVLLSAGGGLFGPVTHGLVFNDMLTHLLQGRFDVDPPTIGDEGYLRDGAVYSYFGILPALVRLIVLPFPGFATTDFTRVGCLAAVALMSGFKLLTAATVARRIGTERAPILLPLMFAAILLSGVQIEFLRPSIFQEVVLWAGACAAAFIYLAVRGWLDEAGFTPRLMAAMALVAGLCLLARVSTALGLYLAFAGLWLVLVWRDRSLWRAYAPALVILVLFAVVTGTINIARWGDPLIFMDLNRALILARFPERLARVRTYGQFNLIRLPFGLSYYFAPLWVLRDGSGQLLWQAFQHRLLDAAELPPASFFTSDPFWVGLAAFGLVTLLRRDRLPRHEIIVSMLPGLVVPAALMLVAISMAFRYRLEFFPLIELCAFAGFARLLQAPTRRATIWMGAGVMLGIVMAHATWLIYMLSPFGPADTVLNGVPIVAFYRSLLP